jgi:Rho-binding antiterminator
MSGLISCELHDYFEIACMHRYQLSVVLNNGAVIMGEAQDIRQKEKREHLCLRTDQGNEYVNLTDIKSMTALTTDALFQTLTISTNKID